MHGGPKTAFMRDPNSGRWAASAGQHYRPETFRSQPLPHAPVGSSTERGPEGVFVRDPATGRWTRSLLAKQRLFVLENAFEV